jgi:hypothetical protein
MAYYSIEPWGPERADLNAGIITSTLANIHRDSKRRPEPFSPADFMPKYGQPESIEDDQDGMAPEKVMAVMERLREHQDKVGRSEPPRRGRAL